MCKHLILFILLCAQAMGVQAQMRAPAPAVLSGGVGAESRAEMRTAQRHYKLKFVFTLREGEYIADVKVKITNARSQIVVDELVPAPLMLARLPAGQYVATAAFNGVTQTRQFTLGRHGLHTIHWRWRRTAADGPPAR